jgi:asparagine synthase (glutamine-hydrolysing)
MWDDPRAIDELQSVLSEAVALRMEADVPVGAFLSGGIDSSVVVALMQAQSSKPVRTFSIGFEEAGYDEAPYAKAVAAHLKTDHTEYYVTSQEARDLIPRLPEMYDEPFGDSSQIPTHLVSARARQDVTVCLSGDGGDELFCGYNRYFTLSRLWRRIERCPTLVRRIISKLIPHPSLPVSPWRIGRRLQLIRKLLAFENGHDAYYWFHAHWREPCDVVQHLDTNQEPMGPVASDLPGDLFEQMAFRDAVSYLPDDILVKVDRASMAVGLEARVPMLDHRVVDLAWQLPVGFKVRGGQGKWVLRQLLQRFVPRQLVERPKMGFGVPLDSWLRGPLRDWSEALLDERRLRDEGYFNPAAVRKKWDDHLTGKCDWQYLLWDVLMFQAWLEAGRV